MMINENELRIGNWVYKLGIDYIEDHPVPDHNDTTAVIVDLNVLNNIINHDGTINMPCYDPIPLTPEILEKAGFKKTGRYAIGAGGYITYGLGKIELLQPKKGDPFALAFYEAKVESLHQLQNLYFALTGEELEIKL